MCGIAGAVDLTRAEPITSAVMGSMLATLRHRGPDDEGTYFDDHIALGARRLSIVDLAGGHQPLSNEDGSVWVVQNGEIFNYPALRSQLETRGHRFATNCDTEVLVHAYEEWGTDLVTHLNGQFAFALWDKARQRLLLARDRTGINPLYYWHRDGALVFGSELRAVVAHPDAPRELDLTAVDQYLTYEHIPVPRSIFKEIAKLPPGHILTLDRNGLKLHQYWDMDLAQSERAPVRSVDEWVEEFRATLTEAIGMELMSDVPLGVFLSGGIDSSTIAALMTEAGVSDVQSFSIAFDDPSFDESSHARLVARHLNTTHHERTVTETELLNLVPQLSDILDEPLGDSSFIPSYFLAQFAREHVTVALGGDGGDELLAGYSTLQAHRLADTYNLLPGLLRTKMLNPLAQRLPLSMNNISLDFKVKRFTAWADAPPIVRHHLWLGSFSPADKLSLLRPEVREAAGSATFDLAADYYNHGDARKSLNRILYMDMKLYLDTDILTKVDRSSMANSLEVRVPFLNQIVLDFASRLPLNMKLRGFTRKYLLRKAVRDMIPASIIKRPKKGFNMPVAKWFRSELRELLQDTLSEGAINRAGLFEYAAVQRLLDDHLQARRDNRKLLWTLLVFQLWHDKWMSPHQSVPLAAPA